MHDFYQKQQEIRNAFNSVQDTYDDYSEIQQKIGSELINYLLNFNKSNYNNVLDLGCGTGLTTQKLLKAICHNKSYACDFAQNLLFLASKRLENFGTVMHNSDFYYALNKKNYYDLIFSNMSFQWCLDIKILLSLVYQNLKMDGVLCFSIPLNGTFKNLPSQSKNTFYHANYFKKLFTKAGYRACVFEEKNIVYTFPSLIAAIKSIKNTGANVLIDKNKINKHFIFGKKFVRSEFKLNYNMGFFIVKK
jgi:malonyl-CoA O-methyltransferase